MIRLRRFILVRVRTRINSLPSCYHDAEMAHFAQSHTRTHAYYGVHHANNVIYGCRRSMVVDGA